LQPDIIITGQILFVIGGFVIKRGEDEIYFHDLLRGSCIHHGDEIQIEIRKIDRR
jgi:hypothetical protein